MWNLQKIKIKNLFSHVDTEYEFVQNTCTLIQGENRSDRGCENNGAGKTTIFEGICLALTGETLRGVKRDVFINRDANECEIELIMVNNVLRSVVRIQRCFYRGNKSAVVKIWENDKEDTQLVSVNECNQRIYDILGLTREDLLRYFIIGQDSNYTFFTASDGDKKEILNRITSANKIDGIVVSLQEELKDNNKELSELNNELYSLNERYNVLTEQKQSIIDNSSRVNDCIEDAKNKINEIESNNKKLNKSNSELLNKVREQEMVILEMEKTLLNNSELNIEKRKIKDEISRIEDEIDDTKSLKRKLVTARGEIIVCPKCKFEFLPNNDLDLQVSQIDDAINQCDSNIRKLEKRIEKKKNELADVLKKIKKQEEENEKLDDLKFNLKQTCRDIKSNENEIANNIKLIKEYNDFCIKLRKETSSILLKDLNVKINDTKEKIKSFNERIKVKSNAIDMINFWLFHMGKSGFTTYLANRSLSLIEGATNKFLQQFNTDLSVIINGFKVLKSGEVREKIDVFVTHDGITSEQFMAKSGGERGRVTLAGIFGIQYLINLSTNGRGLNFLAIDEALSGIDTRGQERMIYTLENLGVTTMLITQNVGENFNVDNIVNIVKENNISFISVNKR